MIARIAAIAILGLLVGVILPLRLISLGGAAESHVLQ